MKKILSKDDEFGRNGSDSWPFWRNLGVYFCAFSVLGHFLEIGYCSVMDVLFHVVSDDTAVFDDPFYPYLVYGVGVVVCALVLEPLKEHLISKRKTLAGAVAEFFTISVFVFMLMELVMGWMLNQPDPETGRYPLWDNSQLPLNIFKQAWLVNDIGFALIGTLYTWVIYPLSEKLMAKLPKKVADRGSIAFIVAFIILCIVKFS